MDDRLKSGLATLLVQGLLFYGLIAGLAMSFPRRAEDQVTRFALTPDRPLAPPVVQPRTERTPRPEGRAAPPNLVSKATPVVAPPPMVPLVVPPPIVTAPIADSGVQATSGAAPIAGPGPGAGGIGDGRGSGGAGKGTGGGGSGSPPVHISGRLRNSDFPRAAIDAGEQGTVEVRYEVDVDGRIGRCEIIRSSGSARLDDNTCRLLKRRYRFRPATDERGRPVRALVEEFHSWIITPREPR